MIFAVSGPTGHGEMFGTGEARRHVPTGVQVTVCCCSGFRITMLTNQQGMTPPVYESVSFAPLHLSHPEDGFHADSEGHENLGQKLLGNRRWQRKVIFKC